MGSASCEVQQLNEETTDSTRSTSPGLSHNFIKFALKLFVLFRFVVVIHRVARFILVAAAAADGGTWMMLMQ
jgi:hypothetical protein